MKILRLLLIMICLVASQGCAGMTSTQQRVLSGSAFGTAAGVGAAAILGGPLLVGAITGAAAGAVGGIIVDSPPQSP